MSDLIKQVGGIEKAKKIIAEMPRYAVIYSTVFDQYFDGLTGEYEDIILDDLRQTIADHGRKDTCVGIGKIDSLHPEFAKVLHDNFLDLITDNCSDIKNHLSPSTEVIER